MKTSRDIVFVFASISPILFVAGFLILGVISPQYDPIAFTISELVIFRYSIFQQLNFLQYGIGFFCFALSIRSVFSSREARRLWLLLGISGLLFSLGVILFPTVSLAELRLLMFHAPIHGIIHFLFLITFFAVSPFGIRALASSLAREKRLKHLATLTCIYGYTCTICCMLWTIMFFLPQTQPYLGLFQKIIVSIFVAWQIHMLHATKRFREAE